ncbi:MAG: hypothetical protein E6K71_05310 [Candidatus Eisenbacteria bacterium]|uniref:Uncharacterized protein n=1 Tax=Eiseniibacteriota bacterium TaxID=2212470 RepID=A0A538SCY0_UNCEI|nr:MAG: hypothetical protein E6K71_05310 [Candidatus Eisenbacteria bacterium]
MADVMEERIRSIERTAGFAFVIASVLLGTTMLAHPLFRDVNMAFLLHMKGSSGSASIVTTCALVGGALWVTFLSAETYAIRFYTNLYGIDPGGATMLFSTLWFWKIGALNAGALLFFAAVLFGGMAAVKRELIPVWLGWGGALLAGVGAMVYVGDFWSTTATGAASQPMQWPAMRYGVGLPLQLWMLGVGVIFLRRYFSRTPMRVTYPRPEARAPGAGAPRRLSESAARPSAEPAHTQGASGVAPGAPAAPRIPHPAFAPDPEPAPPQSAPRGPEAGAPKRPPPPQIFPG